MLIHLTVHGHMSVTLLSASSQSEVSRLFLDMFRQSKDGPYGRPHALSAEFVRFKVRPGSAFLSEQQLHFRQEQLHARRLSMA